MLGAILHHPGGMMLLPGVLRAEQADLITVDLVNRAMGIAFANNYHPGLLRPHPLYETLVALIPAAIGAMVGAGTRWIVGQARA